MRAFNSRDYFYWEGIIDFSIDLVLTDLEGFQGSTAHLPSQYHLPMIHPWQ